MEPESQTVSEIEVVSEAVESQIAPEKLLKYQQEQWIDYCAVAGIIATPDGEIEKLTIQDFAERIGVSRRTLVRWKTSIPNFWDRVGQRRMELGGQERLSQVVRGVFLKARTGDPGAAKLYLGMFAGWQPPAQKHEVKTDGGLADLLNVARERKRLEATNIQEGEIVDVSAANNA